MDAGLNVLLGKVGRPVVLNGKLLCFEKSPLLVSRPGYSREYRVVGKDIYFSAEQGDQMIAEQSDEFAWKYESLLAGTGVDPAELLPPTLDSFTGAIVLENSAFHEISKLELHDGSRQFQPAVSKMLTDFVVEYTVNWFEIYLYLFNRRISAQHMPYSVRGHFVAGLFQPLIVETRSIRSPLSYGENQWFHQIFRDYEEQLRLPGESDRRLTLSAVAMCDIATVFRVPSMFNLDRKLWVFMMELLLTLRLAPEVSSEMSRQYSRLLSRVLSNPRAVLERQGRLLTAEERVLLEHQDYAALFSSMTDYVMHMNQQLRTV